VTNPHQHPTDFAQEIHIQWIRILAGSITSVTLMLTNRPFLTKQNTQKTTQKLNRKPKPTVHLQELFTRVRMIWHYEL